MFNLKEYQRNYHQVNFEKIKAQKKAHRKEKWLTYINSDLKKYGITWDDYYSMLQAQDSACAICFTVPDEGRLFVDHCHSSGVVRGLLCNQCNSAIGKFKDNPATLRSAANYLEQFNNSTTLTEV